MTKVCRLCLAKLQRGSKFFNINAVESFTGFMPYRDQLTTCIPEMALDLIPNPVICNNCRTALKSSYDFKSRCLLVEKKIREYVEGRSPGSTNFNLSEIDTSSLPKPAKYEAEVQRDSPKKHVPILPKVEIQQQSASMLSNLLTVKKEIIIPNPSEIEITNLNFKAGSQKSVQKKIVVPVEDPNYPPIERDESGQFSCNHCGKKFPNIPALHAHKTRFHGEDYICNFCNIPFKTLQTLRRHNQQCMKVKTNAPTDLVLTKRPHLPAKAKTHLKRWLFKHTDHPYPTDVEKQQLMKETNLSLLQVENWFINARRRILADLTKLKNMRGRPPRGRGRRWGKTRVDEDCDDLFDDEERLLEEEEETRNATQLLQELEPDESTNQEEDDTIKQVETSLEEVEEDINEDSYEDVPDNPIETVVENSMDKASTEGEDKDSETNSDKDPLEDIPLNQLAAEVKMEIEIDER